MGEWSSEVLGSLCDFCAGSAFPKNAQGLPTGDYPFIKVSDMNLGGNERHITESNNWVTECERRRMKAKLHPAGAVAFAKIGVALTFNRRRILGRPTIIDNNMMSAVPRESAVDRAFFYYLLRTVDFNTIAAGTALPYLNVSDLRQMPVQIPPLPTQRRIAHILGTLDDKIELNRRMNRTLEKMAAAIFKSWFIDFDPVRRNAARARNQPSPPSPLPVGEGWPTGRGEGSVEELDRMLPDTFEDSVLGPIPKGWKVGSLGDLADSPRRGVNPSDVPPTTPYIGLEHMPRRCIALDAWGRAEDVASGKSQFKQGEILFGKLRPYFHKVGIAPMEGVCSTDIVVVTPKSQDWHGYVVSLVSSKAFVDYTDSHSAGTKMPRTNWKDMSRYPLALPPLSVAKAFQSHVSDFHRRIVLNVRQNRRLAGLRDALLPKLLSGEIEITDAEAVTEEVSS